MTKEENEVIEFLKKHINESPFIFWGADRLKTLLNYINKLQKENQELKNKVVKRDNEIIQLEESAEKEFLTKQEVNDNYIPKDKIRKIIEKLKNEEKALRKDFEKYGIQIFELHAKAVLIQGYEKLLEEEQK